MWEQDLKAWIAEWEEAELVRVDGREPRERVPKRNHGHTVVAIGQV
jgi:hypothetical protein